MIILDYMEQVWLAVRSCYCIVAGSCYNWFLQCLSPAANVSQTIVTGHWPS